MNFGLDQEQEMLRDSVTRFLRDRYRFEDRRAIVAGDDFGSDIWSAFADTLGILGAALPETAGGLAGGPVATMVVMEALGGALVVEPYLETAVIGGGLLKRCPGERAAGLLREIVAGHARTAFAAAEPDVRYALTHISTRARRVGDGWVIDGAKSLVDGAPLATHLIVAARTAGDTRAADGISLFLVQAKTPGIIAHPYRLIDGRTAADLRLNGVRAPADALLGAEGAAAPLIEQVLDEANAAICAEAVGIMRRMLQDTVDYTRQRRQFGQPLAALQALQHRMVDMYMALERAVSAALLATLRLDADPVVRALAVSAAKVTVARSARMIGQNAVQLHGGMGITEELPLGHYFRRATVIERQLGTIDHHLARYAAFSRADAA